ncbi:MAG: hypothetical protein II821_04205, partial [Treponema sp.]|nr:hypothetical protein [Treponema sp.]
VFLSFANKTDAEKTDKNKTASFFIDFLLVFIFVARTFTNAIALVCRKAKKKGLLSLKCPIIGVHFTGQPLNFLNQLDFLFSSKLP